MGVRDITALPCRTGERQQGTRVHLFMFACYPVRNPSAPQRHVTGGNKQGHATADGRNVRQ